MDALASRSNLLHRQETVKALIGQVPTRGSESFNPFSQYSHTQNLNLTTSVSPLMQSAVDSVQTESAVLCSGTSAGIDDAVGSPDAVHVDPVSFHQGSSAVTMPTHRSSMAARWQTTAHLSHEVSEVEAYLAATGAAPNRAYSSSVSVGSMERGQHTPTWQQLAKMLKQDSQHRMQPVAVQSDICGVCVCVCVCVSHCH